MRDFDDEFNERHLNLVKDLEYLDLKINSVNRNIIFLQSNIDRITAIIDDAEDNKLRSQYYGIQNEMLKTLALYDNNMQSLLDLKHKYRKEQDDLSVKSQRFLHIELERVKSDIAKSNTSHTEVIETLTRLLSGSKAEEIKNKPIFDFSPDELI